MRRLLVRSVWRLFGRRLGWVAVATVARTVLRRGTARQVDEASSDLEQRLPEPVRNALTRLPGDPVRLGGGAVVAGRSARQVAAGAGRLSRAADDGRRRAATGLDRAATAFDDRPRPARSGRALAARLGAEVRAETDDRHRELRSRMLSSSRGRGAADDALLDRREPPADRPGGATDRSIDRADPEAFAAPPPVRAGRWRAPRRRAAEKVARVQRTYHQPRPPWER